MACGIKIFENPKSLSEAAFSQELIAIPAITTVNNICVMKLCFIDKFLIVTNSQTRFDFAQRFMSRPFDPSTPLRTLRVLQNYQPAFCTSTSFDFMTSHCGKG